jgi:hypothetical protein
MLRRSIFVLLFSVLVGNAYAAIDLTPAVTDRVEDGVTYREASFKTPEGKLLFVLPPGWTIFGDKDRAQMASADKLAQGAIEVVLLQKPAPLDDGAITKFKEQVLASLPVGAAKVVTVSEAQNTIMPGGNPSFEFVISYDLWGKSYQRSVLLVNGPKDRLTFRFTCSTADFPVFNTHFRRSLMTWHAIETPPASNGAIADAGAPSHGTN